MSDEEFLDLVCKYNDGPVLFLMPDKASVSFVHSCMQNRCFDGAFGDPFQSSSEFMLALSTKSGLEVLNVESRGGNCFFHAFWVAYYGSQPNRDDICRVRHSVACRIFSKWSDPVFRSSVTVNPDYSEFVDNKSGVFNLSVFLSQVSDESRANYQLEGDGLMFSLVAEIFNSVIVIVTVKSEGSLSRIVVGDSSDDTSKSTVYVAWNGLDRSAHYFAFLGPGNTCARVIKWAEFNPGVMIGVVDDVRDLTPQRKFRVKCRS